MSARYFLGPAASGATKMFGRPVGKGGEVSVQGVNHGQLAGLLSTQVLYRLEDDSLGARVRTLEELCSALIDQNKELQERITALESKSAKQSSATAKPKE